MTIALFLVSLISLCLILVLGFRLRSTVLANPSFDISDGPARSPNFYRPMERLLSNADFRFLQTSTNLPKKAIDKMRRERRKIFRKYLGFLACDFAFVTAEIRSIMVSSKTSRVDLAKSLVQARVLFTAAMFLIELRLILHACGVRGFAISAIPLTLWLEQMKRELGSLRPNPVLAAYSA